MKKTLPILTLAVVMTACTTQPKSNSSLTKAVSYEDTAGFAAFQNWKAQNERKDPSLYYMQGSQATTSSTAPVAAAKRAVVTRPRTVTTTTTQPVAATTVKKGWSKAAKGTAIGGAAGAIAGAIISKDNRWKGGAIGAVAGGGLGYVIGRSMDKKDGRN